MRKVRIGIIGCGVISRTYLRDLTGIYGKWLEVAAVANRTLETARRVAREFGISRACSIEELLADPTIEIVVNLTVPAAHTEINKRILQAGKHVFCEKPLALSLAEAQEVLEMARKKQLLVCCAPELFLNSGLQTARKALDQGKIGCPILATANMVKCGPEINHPNPDFFYQPGGGPLLDMGPYYLSALVALLGPIQRVSCLSTRPTNLRRIYSQPRRGEEIPVSVDTTYLGLLQFRSGLVANLTMSFDVWRSDLPCLQIYGSEGSLRLPDPNLTRGSVSLYRKENLTEYSREDSAGHSTKQPQEQIRQKRYSGNQHREEQQELYEELPPVYPLLKPEPEEYMRGLGVVDMAFALVEGRSPRAGADLSYHVTEVMDALICSAADQLPRDIHSSCQRPTPVQCGEFK